MKNIFDLKLPKEDSEFFQTLFKKKGVEIKTVISNTISTPQDFISDKDEWVVLLQGCAKIEMNSNIHKLKKGDTLFIPKNTKHTLLKTKKLVYWLCVYL